MSLFYDSGIVLFNLKDHFTVRAHIYDCARGKIGAALDVSIGTRKIRLHSQPGRIKPFIKKMQLLQTGIGSLVAALRAKSPHRFAYRKFLNPAMSAMGGSIYSFAEFREENGEPSVHAFVELSDCTNKIRLWYYDEADIQMYVNLLDIISVYITELEKL